MRVDIPDKADPDHGRLHNRQGVVVEVVEDDAGQTTGDVRDSYLFRVELQDGSVVDLRWRDLRPSPDDRSVG